MKPPQASPTTQRICSALHQRLPAKLEHLQRRAVQPASPLTAAWGGTAVILRCGVGVPKGLKLTSELYDVNGVSWYRLITSTDVEWTTYGRRVRVEVTVPTKYSDQGPFLVDLAPAITAAVPTGAVVR